MRDKPKEIQQELKNLGKRIRSLRKMKGYTNADIFAYENNIDRSQYGKYERGLDMTFSSILRITKALDISLKEFFNEGFNK